MKQRVLVVEDEESIREALVLNLEMENYAVSIAIDGEEAIRQFRQNRFDLIVLDVMLPKIDGFQVCQTIRLENNRVPILFLTAKNTAQDRIQGLKLGGDDYLPKPFNLEEFLLRIEKLLARSSNSMTSGLDSYAFGGHKIDFTTYQASLSDGSSKELSKKEAMLLKLMIERQGEVVSREMILESIWGYDAYPSTRTIDNFILAFRKYFEKDPKSPVYFHSVRGVGYRFVNPT